MYDLKTINELNDAAQAVHDDKKARANHTAPERGSAIWPANGTIAQVGSGDERQFELCNTGALHRDGMRFTTYQEASDYLRTFAAQDPGPTVGEVFDIPADILSDAHDK